MKKDNKMPLETKNTASAPEEQAKEVSSSTDSQTDKSLPADRKVMATHGFLKILSTIKRR